MLDIDIPLVYSIVMTPIQLKKWRKHNGYSQSQLSKVLEVAPITISRWERGDRSIPSFLHLALRCIELEGGVSILSHLHVGEKVKKGGK